MTFFSLRRRDASDAAAQEVAVPEHGLVPVEELGTAAAVGEARGDTPREDPDEGLLVAVAENHRAAFVAVANAQRAALRRMNLEDGVGAELDVEEDARRRALPDRKRVLGIA